MSYIYTAGVDSSDTWVLCDPKNETRDLRDVYISSDNGDDDSSLSNLLNILNFGGHFDSPQSKINCHYFTQSEKFLTVDLYVQGKLELICREINWQLIYCILLAYRASCYHINS